MGTSTLKAESKLNDSLQGTSKDSIPQIEYNGYRLYLTHFEEVKTKKNLRFIKISAINTGNKRMELGKGAAQIFPVVNFDESINTSPLAPYQSAIYFTLLEKKVSIPIGAISTNIELKIPMQANHEDTEAEPIVTTTTGQKSKGGESQSDLSVEEKKTVKTKKEKKDKLKKEKTPTLVASSDNIEPTLATNENIGSERKVKEVNLAPTEKEAILVKENEEKAITEPTEEVVEIAKSEIDLAPPTVEEIIAKSYEEGCSDLVLKNLTIMKQNKKSVTLQYELFNQGGGTAHLILGAKSKQQGLAIRANLSSSERLTRGSIPIESIFLHGDEVSINGGESYYGEMKLSLLKFSKFTPVLILELDAYEFVPECDETNNKSSIRLVDE